MERAPDEPLKIYPVSILVNTPKTDDPLRWNRCGLTGIGLNSNDGDGYGLGALLMGHELAGWSSRHRLDTNIGVCPVVSGQKVTLKQNKRRSAQRRSE